MDKHYLLPHIPQICIHNAAEAVDLHIQNIGRTKTGRGVKQLVGMQVHLDYIRTQRRGRLPYGILRSNVAFLRFDTLLYILRPERNLGDRPSAFSYVESYYRIIKVGIRFETMKLGKFRSVHLKFHKCRIHSPKSLGTLEYHILNGKPVHGREIRRLDFTQKLLHIRLYKTVEAMSPFGTVGRTRHKSQIHIIVGIVDDICVESRPRKRLYIRRLKAKNKAQLVATRRFDNRQRQWCRLCRSLRQFLFRRRYRVVKPRGVSNHHALLEQYRSFKSVFVDVGYIIDNAHHPAASNGVQIPHIITYLYLHNTLFLRMNLNLQNKDQTLCSCKNSIFPCKKRQATHFLRRNTAASPKSPLAGGDFF